MTERLTAEALASLQTHAEAVIQRGRTHTHVPCEEILALVEEVRDLRETASRALGILHHHPERDGDGIDNVLVEDEEKIAGAYRILADADVPCHDCPYEAEEPS